MEGSFVLGEPVLLQQRKLTFVYLSRDGFSIYILNMIIEWQIKGKYLRFSEGVSPASFFFLEPPDFELYGVSLLFAFPFFFLFLPPSYSKSESLSGSERSSYIKSQHISILILPRVLHKAKKEEKNKKASYPKPGPHPHLHSIVLLVHVIVTPFHCLCRWIAVAVLIDEGRSVLNQKHFQQQQQQQVSNLHW